MPNDESESILAEYAESTLYKRRVKTMQPYPSTIEAQMRAFYQSLSEKDRRRYAAIEAQKLGRGGRRYIAGVLGCDRHTIAQGVQELTDPSTLEQPRIRRAGGGRKSSLAVLPGLEPAFLQVLEDYTAGSPMQAEVKWTNLTHQEIADRLTEQGFHVSVTVVKQLLQNHNFVRRKAQKRKRAGECAHRDDQFAKIAHLKQEYATSANPILSIDTKKKN